MTLEFQIANLEVVNEVKTPLGAALGEVPDDLESASGTRVIVLVTDGEETCQGDPAAAIAALAAEGFDVHVNIVGFALNDEALRAQFEAWARAGNGSYFDAGDAGELEAAIANALRPTFQVLDASGAVIASGAVGGDPVAVPPGTYTVVVLTDSARRFEGVTVTANGAIDLDLANDSG
jgi:hypothetical protein